jgi:hypothetical protein
MLDFGFISVFQLRQFSLTLSNFVLGLVLRSLAGGCGLCGWGLRR